MKSSWFLLAIVCCLFPSGRGRMLESRGLRSSGRTATFPAVPTSPPPLPHQTGNNLRILDFSEGIARCRAARGTSRQGQTSAPLLGQPHVCGARAERPRGRWPGDRCAALCATRNPGGPAAAAEPGRVCGALAEPFGISPGDVSLLQLLLSC